MKILVAILLVIASIIGLLLIIALFVKKDYKVEREIVINKPKQEVFDYIKMLSNQNNFSKWSSMDPNMRKDYKGTDGTVGFISSWDSDNKNVGKGEQEIIKIDEGNRIDFDLRFIKPFKSRSDAYMTTESTSDNFTKVKWGFSGKWAYPMNLMGLFMNMDKAVGSDFQTGLENLKGILEKK